MTDSDYLSELFQEIEKDNTGQEYTVYFHGNMYRIKKIIE